MEADVIEGQLDIVCRDEVMHALKGEKYSGHVDVSLEVIVASR